MTAASKRAELFALMKCKDPVIKNKDIARVAHVEPATVSNWLKNPTEKSYFIVKSAIKEIRTEQATRQGN